MVHPAGSGSAGFGRQCPYGTVGAFCRRGFRPAHRLRESCQFTSRALREPATRSEEHTSELQSRLHLVCRLLLEKKKNLIILIHLVNDRSHSDTALLLTLHTVSLDE